MTRYDRADPGSDGTRVFCDDAMLAHTENVWQSLHHPAKHEGNPVLVPDRPWEGYAVLQPGTVIHDEQDGCFKMWYNTQPSRDKPEAGKNLCYAVSADGVHWEKPELGLVEFRGSTANNILFQEVEWTHCVLKDEAETDADRRYKLLYWPPGGTGIHGAFSEDGVHWRPCEDNPIVPRRATGDTFSVMRDPASGWYWLYHKTRTPARPIRMISRMVSEDFVRWSPTRRVLAPDAFDPPDTQFYGLSAFPHAGQYLGFLWVYHTYPQTLDMQLVSSRDGLRWDRTADRKLFMHLVPTNSYRGGAFDCTQIYPVSAPVEKDGRLWLFYSGFTVPHNALADDHDGRIGLATFRLDGFCSLDATSPGYALTRPFTWKGNRLRLNAATSGPAPGAPADGGGGITVQIEDEQGQVLPGLGAGPCTPFRGDETEALMEWGGRSDLGELMGRTVQLRFRLEDANLYSFRVCHGSLTTPDGAH